MTTRDAVNILASTLPEGVSLVSSPGRTADEVANKFPNQTLFIDSMGDVVPIAMGLALGLSPLPVVALDTDGSHLFGLSVLATLGAHWKKLSNLTVIVFDDHLYEGAGALPSRLCSIDWSMLGRAFELPISAIGNPDQFQSVLAKHNMSGTYCIVGVNNPTPVGSCSRTIDGIESRYNFVRHIERITGHTILQPCIKG